MTNDHADTQDQPAASQGVYGISVAAELSGIPVQSLRLYESHGLLTPTRSDGGTRRYSADDLARLRRIGRLVADGVNIAGIGRILDLEDDNAALAAENRGSGEKAGRRPASG
ncbi:MerR family transcriptional regulator [Mycobacterium sp.]|uniref:MerR family transcriptional regulator n=1 Tax=Mycobacterium sp. TaxID=1785 RepID=UPI003D0E676A